LLTRFPVLRPGSFHTKHHPTSRSPGLTGRGRAGCDL
jgi:hypothetical protein